MELLPGKYRHFKGKEYELIGVAAHSETLEPMVVYRALYGDGGLWVRPAAMWNEIVERDGYHGPRFQFIGNDNTQTAAEQQLIEQLKLAGITFDAGMTQQELDETEKFFGIRFPAEIRRFLACAYPTAEYFFPWREHTGENLMRFMAFQEEVRESFQFDFHENGLTCPGIDAEGLSDAEQFARLLEMLHQSPRLIPFYAHRCFFDGIDGMPIVSFWQPSDSVLYGTDFQDYLQVEFLGKELPDSIPDDLLKGTGIWAHLIG